MYEASIQSLAERHPDWLWPHYDLRLVQRQVALTGGYLDVLFEDSAGVYWATELKRGRVVPADVRQTLRYWRELVALTPGREVRAMVCGLDITKAARALAREQHVHVELVTTEHLWACAQRAGIDDEDARPRSRKASTVRPSRPRGPAVPRQRNEQRERLYRYLDENWPPGSLDATASRETLLTYWSVACADSPQKYRDMVTDLCLAILPMAPGLCLSNRASAWTTVRLPNQRMLAAVNADKSRVKFDFPAPDSVAEAAAAAGLVRLDQQRQGGWWVQAKDLGRGLSLNQAIDLFAAALQKGALRVAQ